MSEALSVSQLNAYIKGVFDDELVLHDITLFGEIYEFSVAGGMTFVTLKEDENVIRCLHFGTMERYAVGTRVNLFGSVQYSVRHGKVDFVFKRLTPCGEGEIYARFLRLKAQLAQEGLFDHKVPLPRFVRRAAIVTSETGAVLHDFITAVTKYADTIRLDVYPVRVQGQSAAHEIVAALQDAQKHPQGYDVLVIARGGGSLTDLDVFNSEAVARAVAACRIPTLSAVGHETDFTLCDFCASVRAGTPSIAGETVSNINMLLFRRLRESIEAFRLTAATYFTDKQTRLQTAAKGVINALERRADLCGQALHFHVRGLNDRWQGLAERQTDRLTTAAHRLSDGTVQLLSSAEEQYCRAENALDQNNPLRILQSGYAKVVCGDRPLESVDDCAAGDTLRIFLRDGRLDAAVTGKTRRKGEPHGV